MPNLKDEFTKVIKKALENAGEDRHLASFFLEQLRICFANKFDSQRYKVDKAIIDEAMKSHTFLGPVAAKYIDSLQKSNEQYIKIAAVLQKELEEEEDYDIDSISESFYDSQEQEQSEKSLKKNKIEKDEEND